MKAKIQHNIITDFYPRRINGRKKYFLFRKATKETVIKIIIIGAFAIAITGRTIIILKDSDRINLKNPKIFLENFFNVEVMPEEYKELSKEFKNKIKEKIPYADIKHLGRTYLMEEKEGKPAGDYKALTGNSVIYNNDIRVIIHEWFHHIMDPWLINKNNVDTMWFGEGVADYLTYELTGNHGGYYREEHNVRFLYAMFGSDAMNKKIFKDKCRNVDELFLNINPDLEKKNELFDSLRVQREYYYVHNTYPNDLMHLKHEEIFIDYYFDMLKKEKNKTKVNISKIGSMYDVIYPESISYYNNKVEEFYKEKFKLLNIDEQNKMIQDIFKEIYKEVINRKKIPTTYVFDEKDRIDVERYEKTVETAKPMEKYKK